mgnify:CR=1 FL=1
MGKKKLFVVRSVVNEQSCSKRNKLENLAEFVSEVEDDYTERFRHTGNKPVEKCSTRKKMDFRNGFTLKINRSTIAESSAISNSESSEEGILIPEAVIPDESDVIIPPAILTRNVRGKKTEVKEGYVYVVTNPAWEGYVKIGSTLDLAARLSSFNVGSPYGDYELKYYSYVPNRVLEEKTIHWELKTCRVCGEWFKMSSDDAILHIKNRNIHRT